ncbi:MAG: hypothetical protein IJV96_00270 [Clostridia bacterium]|nr:hypothetical protein [Clostridia bacterium]
MEQIYTIPLNEAFDEVTAGEGKCECALCVLERRLEENELDLILGASMMEPAIRIKTNAAGFCRTHYKKMLGMKNRLGLALMLESHLDELKKALSPTPIDALRGKKGEHFSRAVAKKEESCYVCERVAFHMARSMANLAAMYAADEAFRKKYEKAPLLCLPHARAVLEGAKRELSGKSLAAFTDVTLGIAFRYMDALREDVSFFCKKFDYRYADEPWGNAKDAPVRAADFLTGKGE